MQPITIGKLYETLRDEYASDRILLTPFYPNETLRRALFNDNINKMPKTSLNNLLTKNKLHRITPYNYLRNQYYGTIQYGISQGLLLKDVRTDNFLLDTPIKRIVSRENPI